jgi:putative ABC transport system permease protein
VESTSLVRNPSFTLASVTTLALAIGISTPIFSAVEAILLHPLPYADPDRLAVVWETNRGHDRTKDQASLPNFTDWRSSSHSFSALAAFTIRPGTVQYGSEAESVSVVNASSDFFRVLGAPPLAGRFPAPEEVDSGAAVGVLNEGYWKKAFGGDLNIVDKTLLLNGRAVRVIGIMGKETAWPEEGADLWVPMQVRSDWGRDSRFLSVIGRLQPKVSYHEAQAELSQISGALADAYPDSNHGWQAELVPLHEEMIKDVKPMLLLLAVAAGLLSLAGISNVAGLLMARAIASTRETSVRQALGASRADLMLQTFVDGLALAGLGGTLGIGIASAILRSIPYLALRHIPRLYSVQLNRKSLLFTCTITLGTAVVLSVASTFWRGGNRMDIMREEGRGTGSRAKVRMRSTLAVVQVSFTFVLLVSAGLLTRSTYYLLSRSPGFDKDHVLVLTISPSRSVYQSNAQLVEYYRQLMARLRRLPSVEAVGATTALPMNNVIIDFHRPFYARAQQPASLASLPEGNFRVVTPDYFNAMHIPVVRGRAFTDEDHADPPRVVINESLAAQAFPRTDPVGKYLMIDYSGWKAYEVVGVVGDTRSYGLRTEPKPEMYFPQAMYSHYAQMNVAVRASGNPNDLRELVRRQALALDPATPPRNIEPVADLVSRSIERERLSLALLALFAVTALVLAFTAVYALFSYIVTERSVEMAVRMAVGARRKDILLLTLRRGLVLLLLGNGGGLLASLLTTTTIRQLLFGVLPLDALTYATAAALITGAGMLATYFPASRGSRLNLWEVLRSQ